MTLNIEFNDGKKLSLIDIDDFAVTGGLLVIIKRSALTTPDKKEQGENVAGYTLQNVREYYVLGDIKRCPLS